MFFPTFSPAPSIVPVIAPKAAETAISAASISV
jgi:hypothetical protein